MTHSTDHTPARDAIALKLRAYFTDVVRDRQDRAWTRADELLAAYDRETAEKLRSYSCCEYGACPGDCGAILADTMAPHSTPLGDQR